MINTKQYKGLNDKEVLESREYNGSNVLLTKESQTLWDFFKDALQDKWIIILFIALGIKIGFNVLMLFNKSFGEPDWYDVISIAIAILIASGFSSWSAYRNEQKFNALQDEANRIMVKTYRNGKLEEVLINDLVVGDYVLLQQGDKIPADGIIVEGSMKVNQASLNGESEDADKIELGNNPIPDSNDLFTKFKIFRGTVVNSGEAVMKITEVGEKTIFGQINSSLMEEDKISPSKEKLNKLADTIGIMGYSAGAIYLVINLIKGFYSAKTINFSSAFFLIMSTVIYSVTIIIMAVPEGLPMMTTLVAVINSAKLLKQKILLRHTESLETAGYTNIILSDKTGTITEGKLKLVEFITKDGILYSNINLLDEKLKQDIVNCCGLNNDSMESNGVAVGSNATDRCLLDYLIENKFNDFNRDEIESKEQFSSVTKYAAVTLKNGVKYIKGAAEVLVNQCAFLTPEQIDAINRTSENQTARSMRLIALVKETNSEKELIAIACIRDNLRQGMENTIANLNKAGIQVVMVTGDRKETAVAIAKDAGIINSDNDVVLTHDELVALSDEELKEFIPRLKVVSRALPNDKKRVANVAQSLGLIVGSSGDGTNDSPVLKTSDVGYAMGDGTEVAKEASDIIILNNSLSSIERAVLNGRTMTKSVQKFIIFQLTVNVATILISILAPLFGINEPFTIVQILWINLIMDTLASLSFAGEPALDKYMNEKPIDKKDSILTSYMKSSIGLAGLFITFGSLTILNNWFGIHTVISTHDIKTVETFMFTFFIYSILFNSLNTRSTDINIFEHIMENKNFIFVMGGIAIVQSLIIQYGGRIFSTVPMDLKHFGLALALAFLIIPIDFIRKTIIRRG